MHVKIRETLEGALGIYIRIYEDYVPSKKMNSKSNQLIVD